LRAVSTNQWLGKHYDKCTVSIHATKISIIFIKNLIVYIYVRLRGLSGGEAHDDDDDDDDDNDDDDDDGDDDDDDDDYATIYK
jgi:hypothetical protein